MTNSPDSAKPMLPVPLQHLLYGVNVILEGGEEQTMCVPTTIRFPPEELARAKALAKAYANGSLMVPPEIDEIDWDAH